VISTVGPQGEYPGVLEAAYRNSLTLMMDNKLRSVVRTNLGIECANVSNPDPDSIRSVDPFRIRKQQF
jgi:hypothetical protein